VLPEAERRDRCQKISRQALHIIATVVFCLALPIGAMDAVGMSSAWRRTPVQYVDEPDIVLHYDLRETAIEQGKPRMHSRVLTGDRCMWQRTLGQGSTKRVAQPRHRKDAQGISIDNLDHHADIAVICPQLLGAKIRSLVVCPCISV
jgi:hypothetical protein